MLFINAAVIFVLQLALSVQALSSEGCKLDDHARTDLKKGLQCSSVRKNGAQVLHCGGSATTITLIGDTVTLVTTTVNAQVAFRCGTAEYWWYCPFGRTQGWIIYECKSGIQAWSALNKNPH